MAGLTDEQRAFWDEIGFEPPDGEPTVEYVGGIQAAYHFDGYEVPERDAILAEFERRAQEAALQERGGPRG
ncbi:MAG: hypothetical protein WKF94_14650 [Solirubrobacteraceae bacterium]